MLAPCYLVHGGEPLQTEEIICAIKHLASKQGYNSYVTFEVNAQFNWDELLNKCQSLDIFADRSFVDIRLHGDSINKQGQQALEKLFQNQSPDLCVLVRAQKLKAQTLTAPWVKLLQKTGQILVAKPIPAAKWPAWVKQRLGQADFTPSPEVCDYLAKSYEGNLSAAAQCIDKLKARLPAGNLELDQVKPFLDNFSHFSIFDLSDTIIGGDAERTFRVFNGLKDESADPVLMLWAITREIRNLLRLSQDLQSGLSLTQSAQKLGIWRDRLPNIKLALDRLSVTKLQKLLKISKTTDLMIKGIVPGNAWEALLSVCLTLASSKTPTMEDLTI
jgi:DNA polymerase-3 subunit delta